MRSLVILALALVVPTLAAAKDPQPGPTVEAAGLEKLYKGSLEYCTSTGQNEARVGYNCPANAKSFADCEESGKITADEALSACVARRLTRDEQKLWAQSPMNPVRPKP